MSEPVVMSSSVEAVNGAIAIIKEWGWTQKTLGTDATGYCMVGALMKACKLLEEDIRIRPIQTRAILDLGRWLRPLAPWPNLDLSNRAVITFFNDADGRTRDEVLMHLEKFVDEFSPQDLPG